MTDRDKDIAESLDAFFDVGDLDRRLTDMGPGEFRAAIHYRRQVAANRVAGAMRAAGMAESVVSLPACGRVLLLEDGCVVTRICVTPAHVVAKSLPPEPEPAVIEPRPPAAEAVAS